MPGSAAPPRDLVEAVAAAGSTAEQLALLRATFRVEPVGEDHAFAGETVYFVVGSHANYLIRTEQEPLVDGQLHFQSLVDGTAMKPLPGDRLQSAVRRERIYLVEPKPFAAEERDRLIDIGAFSLLLEAAQRSGIVPGLATIIQVRDCEFRLGRHWQALQLMESLQQGFLVAAGQRTQRLAREENDIAAGRIRMSPRELQLKRSRDRQQDQCIERARTRFARVVEGLRAVVQRGL